MEQEWIDARKGIPSDKQLCWIDTEKFGVVQAVFHLREEYRSNFFAMNNGVDVHIMDVKHYMEIEVPNPPKA